MIPDPEVTRAVASAVQSFFDHAAGVVTSDLVARSRSERLPISVQFPVFAFFGLFTCSISAISDKETGEIGIRWVIGELALSRKTVAKERVEDLLPEVEKFRKDGPSLFASELSRSLSYLVEIGVPTESMSRLFRGILVESVMES